MNWNGRGPAIVMIMGRVLALFINFLEKPIFE